MKSLLEKKNDHLKNVIGMLMDTVRDRDIEIEVLRSASSTPHQFSEDEKKEKADKFMKKRREWLNELLVLPSIDESKIAGVIGEDVAFSSKFMPNVKFKYDLVAQKLMSSIPTATTFKGGAYFGYSTDRNGKLYNGYEDFNIYKSCLLKEVSIYEAKPELVPDSMVYDKESDSLKPKFCADAEYGDSIELYMAYDSTFYYTMLEAFERNKVLANSKNNMVIFGSLNETYYTYEGKKFDNIAEAQEHNKTLQKIEDGLIDEKTAKEEIVEKDVAFKVTKVVSKCDSCETKDDCSLLRELHCCPTVSHCDDYQKTDIISSFAKKLAKSKAFNCSEVQWVVDVFGEERVSNILDMLSACGLKLSDIEPLKK